MKKYPKKRTGLWIVIGSVVVLLAVAAVLCFIFFPGSEQEEDYKIYWNVDRELYIDPETGLNTRMANADGLYPVMLAVDGEQKQFYVADMELVSEMDQYDMLGVVQDENGVITDVLALEEFTGGTVMKQFYVGEITQDDFTANSSQTMKGESATYPIENVAFYSVVGEGVLVGLPAQLQLNDRIIGVVDKEGNLTHVFIVESAGPSKTEYCQHCDMEVNWLAWNAPEAIPQMTGHYYLTTDVQLRYQCSLAEEQSLLLDLNGHTVTGGEDRRVFSVHNLGAYLGIMDSSPEKTGKVVAWGQGAHVQGGCVWVRYGMFELFGGTLDASRMNTDLTGTAVHINKDSIMSMYDGTIIGGTSSVYINPKSGNAMGAFGGSVYCDGTLEISGGVIRDGIAQAYLDKQDGKYKRGCAGNVHVSSAGNLTMTGGSILNGYADGDGGNLYVAGTATISGDVTISGGVAKMEGKRGGNILVSGTGNLTMTGGQVANGTSGGTGGNIYSGGNTQWIGVTITGGKSTYTEVNNISAYNNTCLLRDCTVNGDVYAYKTCLLTLAGTTKIEKGEHFGLQVANEVMIEPGELTEGADILITASGYFTEKTNTAVSPYFKLSCEGSVLAANNRLFAGKRYCLCGGKNGHASYCDGTKLLWQAWTDGEKMPTAEGNYYLTTDVKLEKRATVGKTGGTAADARKVAWDLNGHTVTGASGNRVAFVTGFSTLSICDTSKTGTGKLQATGVSEENGHTVFGGSNTVINIYGGTITGGKAQAILKTTTAKDGTVTTKVSNGQGGNVYTYGKLNMYGGSITGGVAKAYYDKGGDKYSNGQGGNVALSSDGEFNFYGGTITGGVADQNGGNLYTAAPVNMYGGTITGGSVALEGKSGGNVYLTGTCTFAMKGGSITGGSATSNGGNVMSYGKFNLSGGEVVNGKAGNLGGNICIGGSGAATISGGTTSGGAAKNGTDADGKPIVDATAASANIIAMNGATFTITGGTVAFGVRVVDGVTLTLGGSPVIEGISLGGNTQANIDGILGENAKIVLTKDRDGYFAVTKEAVNGDRFVLKDGYVAALDETVGMLQIVKAPVVSDHPHCLCNGTQEHNCENVGFLPWGNEESEKTTLPTSGNYYLTCDIVLTDPGSGSGICKITDSLNLCLNGYTVTTTADCARRMFHVSGGTLSITDCSEEKTGKIAAGYATYTAEGGLMLVGSNSTLNLYAGTLSGTDVTETDKNGGTLRSYGTINIYGGTVTGGTAVNGGNIAAGGPLHISGGSILGGTATANGGNIWISSGSADIQIRNTQITGGTAAKGGGVYVNGNVTLAGDLQITGNTGANLYVPDGKSVNIDGALGENTLIHVTANGAFATTTVEENALGFEADDGISDISYDNGSLVLGKVITEHKHCVCAGNENHTDCADVTWTAISGDVGSLNSGYYYLEGPVNLTGSITIGSGKDVYICLNGQTMTAKDGQRAFLINNGGQLHIADCGENGKLTGNATTATANLNGGVIFIMKGTLELFGGTVESRNTVPANTQDGGTIRVGNTAANTGIFRMYGGTITGGVSQKGGNIYIRSGVFEMLGGLVTGGAATTAGDNLFIQNTTDAVAILTGGTIDGGVHLDGPNGTLTITGTTTEEQ